MSDDPRDLFDASAVDPEKLAAELKKPVAKKTYGIFFTPRSGSSWLTDMLAQTKAAGNPSEWFNPNFVPRIARNLNAPDLENYLEILRRRQVRGGTFGFEVTAFQLRRVFGGFESFLEVFPRETPFFYLRRNDIVLQAISLAKAVRTDVYHSAHSDSSAIQKADAGFDYDGAEIAKWLKHILDQERLFETNFRMHGIMPVRLEYETMMAAPPEEVLGQIISVVRPRLDLSKLPQPESKHRKIGSDKNAAFAERFRAEHPGLLLEVAKVRGEPLPELPRVSLGEKISGTFGRLFGRG